MSGIEFLAIAGVIIAAYIAYRLEQIARILREIRYEVSIPRLTKEADVKFQQTLHLAQREMDEEQRKIRERTERMP